MTHRLLPLGLALATLLTSCDQPPVVPTDDRRQNSRTSRIDGELVVQGTARGNAVAFLYNSARPPPPAGTGRPIGFTFIPAEQIYGAALTDRTISGPFTAPYTFSLVPPGQYIIRGFIDHDECAGATGGCRRSDFNPWFGVTAEPNAGDVGGAAVDANTRQQRVIDIKLEEGGVLQAATGIPVSFSDSATIPLDRPAFTVTGTKVYSPTTTTPNKYLDLLPNPIQDGPIDQRRALAFTVKYYDDNRDGTPDGFWPKVVVRKLDEGDATHLTDENDLDHNGILDNVEDGAKDYEHVESGQDGKADLVVLTAGFDPTPVRALLNDSSGVPKRDPVTGDFVALPISSLRLVLGPAALDASYSPPVPLKTLPRGRYAIILISFTGQTWRVPNELQPGVADAAGLPVQTGQDFYVDLAP